MYKNNKNNSSKVGRKNGMFSKPVLRLISNSMRQAVGHTLPRREEAEHPKRQNIGASSALWDHNKLRQQNGIDVLATSFRPASLVAATLGPLRKGEPFFPPDPTFSQVRDALTAVARRDLPGGKERTLLPPLPMQRYRHDQHQLSSISSALEDLQENLKRIDQLLATTPERKRPNKELFPEKPPMQIAAKLLESQPGITLRPNESTTMSDTAFSLVRRMFAARERYKEQTGDGQMPPSKSSSGLDGTDRDGPEDPFRALLDQTMWFDQEQNDQQRDGAANNCAPTQSGFECSSAYNYRQSLVGDDDEGGSFLARLNSAGPTFMRKRQGHRRREAKWKKEKEAKVQSELEGQKKRIREKEEAVHREEERKKKEKEAQVQSELEGQKKRIREKEDRTFSHFL